MTGLVSRTGLILAGFVAITVASACGRPTDLSSLLSSNDSSDPYRETGWDTPAVRIVFREDAFTDLGDFAVTRSTQYRCLGDAHKLFKADGEDYHGSPTTFEASSVTDYFSVTNRPAFLKSVSVDITRTYHPETVSSTLQTDSCSYRGIGTAAGPATCADFDRAIAAIPTPTVFPTATPVATPVADYETGYYRVRDSFCSYQGPIISSDPETTKSFVGGVNIDIDRDELGDAEDLLMVVTYHSLNDNSTASTNWPAAQTTADHTILKVNMVQTTLDLSSLLTVKQPRAWSYYPVSSYPVLWENIATLEDPWGSLRSEQILIPLSKSTEMDRIRIERVRGSYLLFQVDLYRLGNRS